MSSTTSDEIVEIPDSSSDESSDDSSLVFMLNIIEQAAIQDTASSRRVPKERDRPKALKQLMDDYFNENSLYNATDFRNTYKLPKDLFLKLVEDIGNTYEWFQPGDDARGKPGFTPIQKCISALSQLATGEPPVRFDNYLKMSARTSRECLDYFCIAVIDLYHKEFLRRPTSRDVSRLYRAHEDRHYIPGMLGSIDCTHFVWRFCPKKFHGQYRRGDHQYPTVMLEAVASQDLWIWHAYFGPSGSNNDINVLNTSSLFLNERNKTAPNSSFIVKVRTYKRGYYLADGGYPNWSTFVKAFSYPTDPKEKNSRSFKRRQGRMLSERSVFLRRVGAY